jgi:hypothetical protein
MAGAFREIASSAPITPSPLVQRVGSPRIKPRVLIVRHARAARVASTNRAIGVVGNDQQDATHDTFGSLGQP